MQQRCSTHLVATLILLLAIVELLEANFIFEVHFMAYKSVQHRRVDGFCCDPLEDVGNCTECHNQFLFCLRPSGTPRSSGVLSRDDEICPLGNFKTGNISGDDMTFERGQDLEMGVPNPMQFTLEAWPVSVELYVRVDDVDLPDQAYDGNDMVAQFDIPVVLGGNVSRIERRQQYDRIFHGVFVILGFELSCIENYYGDDCSVFCVPRDDDLGHYKCRKDGHTECLEGFQDTTSNCTVCKLSEGCSHEGSYCSMTDHCICHANYTGKFCDIDLDPCGHGAPCLNNGSCSNNQSAPGSYFCNCSEDFGGTNCELDLNPCLHKQPCLNDATCSNKSPGDYACECLPGYEGKDCESETKKCQFTPCKNGATCEDFLQEFSCLCTTGFTGTTCETDVNECTTNPCLNGGVCQNTFGSYECHCEIGSSGKDCQAANGRNLSIAEICGGVIGFVLLILIILVMAIAMRIWIKKLKATNHNDSSQINVTQNQAYGLSQALENIDSKQTETNGVYVIPTCYTVTENEAYNVTNGQEEQLDQEHSDTYYLKDHHNSFFSKTHDEPYYDYIL